MFRIERPRDDSARLSSTLGIESSLFLDRSARTGYFYRESRSASSAHELVHVLTDRVAIPMKAREPTHTRRRALIADEIRSASAATVAKVTIANFHPSRWNATFIFTWADC